MSATKLLFISLTLSPLAWADFSGTGFCQRETYLPNLPRASCEFPVCPAGSDCTPPAIDRASARLEYNEPFVQWQGSCPDHGILGPCWAVRIGFTLWLGATSHRVVTDVGANFAVQSNGRNSLRKYWGKAERDVQGGNSQLIHGEVLAYAVPGQKLKLSVSELCARDGAGNEGCVLPLTPLSN